MIDQPALVKAISDVATRWLDPAYPQRLSVVEDTLVLENRFTEEALTFAINQQMSLLTVDALHAWLKGRQVREWKAVGVLNAGNIPLVGLQDWLAVVMSGAAYRGVLSSRSPHLLPAFAFEVIEAFPDLQTDFVAYSELYDDLDAVIASGSYETMQEVAAACDNHQIPQSHRLLRGHKYSIAVLTGKESPQMRENLAEDVLLHEGLGCRNAAIIWAPEGLAPDPYLESFAYFRSIFPVHPRTPGSLKMKQAFLAAVDVSHAYGEGMEFLVSKGDPEPQEPGHVRWVEYRTEEELVGWIRDHKEEIQLIVAGQGQQGKFDLGPLVVSFGDAQRPTLDWCADTVDTLDFLQAL
ncbi:MAG: hypothetical protein AAF564_20425 [Bacteroidota bacterium]